MKPGILTTIRCLITMAFAEGAPKVKMQTFTYKKVGDLEIKADVNRPGDEVRRPVLVYIHGGALINGGRQSINKRIKESFLGAGYAIVSIDYRLAPETQLPGIIEDLEDAFKWLRRDGARLFNVDTSKIAVAGGSAGGCLTLVSGFRVKPAPTVLVSLWGYGDLMGEWYSTPSPHKRHNAEKVAWEEVAGMLDGPVIANGSDRRRGNGGKFYRYCRQKGLWPKLVTGFDPGTEAEKIHSYMAVKHVTGRYPPTLLLHGTADTDVPYQQSVMMAKQFEKHGVPHKFIGIQNAEHGLRDGDPSEIDRAYAAVLTFVKGHMK